MTEIQCKVCRASNPAGVAACFSCGAKFRREGESAPEPVPSATSGSRAADASGRYAAVIASVVAMCLSSYIMLLTIQYAIQSRRIALLVATALWIAYLIALFSRRWVWVLCLSLFPVPAFYLISFLLASLLTLIQ